MKLSAKIFGVDEVNVVHGVLLKIIVGRIIFTIYLQFVNKYFYFFKKFVYFFIP